MKKLLILSALFISFSSIAANDLCAGDKVIDNHNRIGKVREVFDNGKVKVRFDGYLNSEIKSLSDLSKGQECVENVCVGDKFIDNNNYTGVIKEIFNNGKAQVKLTDYFNSSIANLKDLSKEHKCVEGACVGDRFIDNNGYTGVIKKIFNNGKTKVRFDGHLNLSTKYLNELGYPVDCSENKICLNVTNH